MRLARRGPAGSPADVTTTPRSPHATKPHPCSHDQLSQAEPRKPDTLAFLASGGRRAEIRVTMRERLMPVTRSSSTPPLPCSHLTHRGASDHVAGRPYLIIMQLAHAESFISADENIRQEYLPDLYTVRIMTSWDDRSGPRLHASGLPELIHRRTVRTLGGAPRGVRRLPRLGAGRRSQRVRRALRRVERVL